MVGGFIDIYSDITRSLSARLKGDTWFWKVFYSPMCLYYFICNVLFAFSWSYKKEIIRAIHSVPLQYQLVHSASIFAVDLYIKSIPKDNTEQNVQLSLLWGSCVGCSWHNTRWLQRRDASRPSVRPSISLFLSPDTGVLYLISLPAVTTPYHQCAVWALNYNKLTVVGRAPLQTETRKNALFWTQPKKKS